MESFSSTSVKAFSQKRKELLFLDENGFTEIEENNPNDTLACDDDAHKVVMCTPSLFLRIIIITNFTSNHSLNAFEDRESG